MAIILNLETATTNCSVSVAKEGKLLLLKEDSTPNYSHSEQLHNFIQQALKEASLSLEELDAIAVSKGPGSYTGLRIGVSAAKGLCFSLGIPLISVATLQSMTHQMKVREGEFVISLLDARRMEVYAAIYDKNHVEVRETRAEIVEEHTFSEYAGKENVWLIGSGAEKCKNLLKHPNFNFETTIMPSAREMGELSELKFQNGDFEDVAYFEPYYLKDFIALQKKKN